MLDLYLVHSLNILLTVIIVLAALAVRSFAVRLPAKYRRTVDYNLYKHYKFHIACTDHENTQITILFSLLYYYRRLDGLAWVYGRHKP